MFNTYVINLKHDKNKLNTIIDNLNKTGIQPIRFNAINGKERLTANNKKMVTTRCLDYCPYSAIGIGLSHIILAKQFYNNDPNNYCLILEDDAKPLYNDIKKKINEIVNTYPPNWDIIKLYCQGICNYNKKNKPTKFSGSMCAYLLSKRGAKKMSNIRLKWHIDVQINYMNINIYNSMTPLFVPDNNISSSYTNNNNILKKIFGFKLNKYDPTVDWYLGNAVFRLPYTDTTYNYYQLIGIIFLIIVIIIIASIGFIKLKKR